VIRPPANRAVDQLQRRAEEQRQRGEYDAAAASLERALRIAPDDAVLWHRLASLRLDQGMPAMVTELAAKSNTLAAPSDNALKRDNWRLIAQARRGLGDGEGADHAERMAQQFQR
jgi:predicted Zn-dependent protease